MANTETLRLTIKSSIRDVFAALEKAVAEAQGKGEDIVSTKIYNGVFTYHIANSEGKLFLFIRNEIGDEDKEDLLAETSANDPVGDITWLFGQRIYQSISK